MGFLYSSMTSKYWITPELCSWIFSTFIYCFSKLLHFHVIKFQIHTSHRPIFLTPESHIQFLTIVTSQMSNRVLKLSMSKTKFLLHILPSQSQLIAKPLASCSYHHWSFSFPPNTILYLRKSKWPCIQNHNPTSSHILVQVTSNISFLNC